MALQPNNPFSLNKKVTTKIKDPLVELRRQRLREALLDLAKCVGNDHDVEKVNRVLNK